MFYFTSLSFNSSYCGKTKSFVTTSSKIGSILLIPNLYLLLKVECRNCQSTYFLASDLVLYWTVLHLIPWGKKFNCKHHELILSLPRRIP